MSDILIEKKFFFQHIHFYESYKQSNWIKYNISYKYVSNEE